MKKKILNIILCSLVTSITFSQEKLNTGLTSQFKINYYLTGLDASYEIPLNNKFTFEAGAGIGAGSYIRNLPFLEESFRIDFNTFPVLRLRSKLKYTYNRENRIKKGKSINHNSGNYFALQGTFSSKKEDVANNILFSELHWGIQRGLGRNWLFNVNAGVGYAKDFNSKLDRIYPTIGLEFSYIIF